MPSFLFLLFGIHNANVVRDSKPWADDFCINNSPPQFKHTKPWADDRASKVHYEGISFSLMLNGVGDCSYTLLKFKKCRCTDFKKRTKQAPPPLKQLYTCKTNKTTIGSIP